MKEFNIGEFIRKYDNGRIGRGSVCMHCNTQDEAENFLNILDSLGFEWIGGRKYTDCSHFDDYKSNTVYYFLEGTYGNVKYATSCKHHILEYDDYFLTPSEICDEWECCDDSGISLLY